MPTPNQLNWLSEKSRDPDAIADFVVPFYSSLLKPLAQGKEVDKSGAGLEAVFTALGIPRPIMSKASQKLVQNQLVKALNKANPPTNKLDDVVNEVFPRGLARDHALQWANDTNTPVDILAATTERMHHDIFENALREGLIPPDARYSQYIEGFYSPKLQRWFPAYQTKAFDTEHYVTQLRGNEADLTDAATVADEAIMEYMRKLR